MVFSGNAHGFCMFQSKAMLVKLFSSPLKHRKFFKEGQIRGASPFCDRRRLPWGFHAGLGDKSSLVQNKVGSDCPGK